MHIRFGHALSPKTGFGPKNPFLAPPGGPLCKGVGQNGQNRPKTAVFRYFFGNFSMASGYTGLKLGS